MISAPGDPPGSRVTIARSFAAARRSASFLICVDFPEPSPPSNEMNFPRPEVVRFLARVRASLRSRGTRQ